MADRAQYLARTLIARLSNLQASRAEDGSGDLERHHRIEVIEKVFAVELGITDGTTMAMVEAALPSIVAVRQAPDREVAALADFLRQRLARQLAGDGAPQR